MAYFRALVSLLHFFTSSLGFLRGHSCFCFCSFCQLFLDHSAVSRKFVFLPHRDFIPFCEFYFLLVLKVELPTFCRQFAACALVAERSRFSVSLIPTIFFVLGKVSSSAETWGWLISHTPPPTQSQRNSSQQRGAVQCPAMPCSSAQQRTAARC